ncbi:ATP-binding protein [Streptomyces sp. DT171]|uniref:ATP-binding protein n=1 Tax=Streptomyces sp. DT171 TaxID=3416524 RepID=UPI003CE6EEBC
MEAIYLADPAAARPARQHARKAAAQQCPGIPADVLDTIELLASELVTNSIRYGSEPGDSLKIRVEARPGRARVEVHDTRRRPPRQRPASDERARGRGLHLVEMLAAGWGVTDRPLGKIVWVVITW